MFYEVSIIKAIKGKFLMAGLLLVALLAITALELSIPALRNAAMLFGLLGFCFSILEGFHAVLLWRNLQKMRKQVLEKLKVSAMVNLRTAAKAYGAKLKAQKVCFDQASKLYWAAMTALSLGVPLSEVESWVHKTVGKVEGFSFILSYEENNLERVIQGRPERAYGNIIFMLSDPQMPYPKTGCLANHPEELWSIGK